MVSSGLLASRQEVIDWFKQNKDKVVVDVEGWNIGKDLRDFSVKEWSTNVIGHE